MRPEPKRLPVANGVMGRRSLLSITPSLGMSGPWRDFKTCSTGVPLGTWLGVSGWH